jgi:septum formation topological specificity factor MinE
MGRPVKTDIPKEELVKIIQKLLKSKDSDLDFLLQLDKKDLETLVVAIREGVQ